MPSPSPSAILSPMHRAMRQFQLLADEYTRPRGFGAEEGHLLLYVDVYGPCPMTELVRVLGIRPSTLTTVIARLADRQFLAASPGVDRRVRTIAITAKGSREAATLREFGLDIEARVRSSVSREEFAAFSKVLSVIHTTLGVQVRHPEKARRPTSKDRP